VVKELEQDAMDLFMLLGKLWRAASRCRTPATLWRPREARGWHVGSGKRPPGPGKRRGRCAGGGGGTGGRRRAGGGRGSLPELSGSSSSRAEQSRLEVDDGDSVANTKKPRDSTVKLE
jgi:hypothetical protein